MKGSYIGFLVFVALLVIFYMIPDPEGLQKPFRILLAVSFGFIFIAQLLRKELGKKALIPAIGAGCLLVIMLNRNTIQTSFFNASLCLIGLICLPFLRFKISAIRRTNLIYIHSLCLAGILIQFLVFSSRDGRPTLAYDINLSGAYLFLFFLFSDVINLKHGKIAVILLSLVTLSRLLIFSIVLFYLVRYLKPMVKNWLPKINVWLIVTVSYVLISFFSIWYVANIKAKISYDTSVSRVTTLNDASNELRFFANTLVLANVYTAPLEAKTLFGYGKVENYIKATKDSLIMPHNELFDAIVEYGIISVLFFSLFTLSTYQKFTNYNNLEFFLPVILYTLILWVRFLLIPSFEMIFILFLLNLSKEKVISH